MKKTIANITFFVLANFALLLGMASCEMLQDSLSSEQAKKQAEDTGVASINGDTWFFDGISTTDFSKTEGATFALLFNRKVAVDATKVTADDGTETYTNKLTGSLTATYTTLIEGTETVSIPIAEGKMKLGKDVSVPAGELSKDDKVFRLNMKPIANLLDASTAKRNEISLEVKLSGFVCPDGKQKGRAVGLFKKTVSVKPFYLDEVVTDGITFSTMNVTTGKKIVIPTQGKVSLTNDAALIFASDDSVASSLGLTSNNFALAVGENGTSLVISCDKELKGKDFVGKLKISGIVPALNGSSYTRTFKVVFSSMTSSADTLAVNGDSNASSVDGFSSDLSSMGVYNDAKNLYVLLRFSNPPTLWNQDTITILIDKTSDSSGAVLTQTPTWGTDFRRGIGTKVALAEGSSVEGQITTFVQTSPDGTASNVCATQFDYGNEQSKELQCTNSAGEAITASFNTPKDWQIQFTGVATIMYAVPLSDLGLSVNDVVYLYAAVTNYDKATGASIADHVPASAVKNADGSSATSDWSNANTSYVIDMTKGLKHTITAAN